MQQISLCKTSKTRRDKYVLELLGKPQQILATILLINNLINVSIVTLSTFMVWNMVGSTSPSANVVALLSIVLTLLIVFLGEIIPKVYAAHNSLSYVRWVSLPLYYLNKLLLPMTAIFCYTHSTIEKYVRPKGYQYTTSSLREAVALAGMKDESQKDMLYGIMNLSSIPVKQIMQSRHDITAVDISLSFGELLEAIQTSGYSRIPVYEHSLDSIKGVLYGKDVLGSLDKSEGFKWQHLIREAYFIPERRKISGLFKDFQNRRVHMAIVVDEYGGTLGLVTLEDIIEVIVGDIRDELDVDKKEVGYRKLDSKTYIFEAKTTLTHFCKALGLRDDFFHKVSDVCRSVGGLLLELHNRLPEFGTRIRYEHLTFVVIKVSAKRIERVRVLVGAWVP